MLQDRLHVDSGYVVNLISCILSGINFYYIDIFPKATPEATDLLGLMLVLDPDARVSAEGALNHSYFQNEQKCILIGILSFMKHFLFLCIVQAKRAISKSSNLQQL